MFGVLYISKANKELGSKNSCENKMGMNHLPKEMVCTFVLMMGVTVMTVTSEPLPVHQLINFSKRPFLFINIFSFHLILIVSLFYDIQWYSMIFNDIQWYSMYFFCWYNWLTLELTHFQLFLWDLIRILQLCTTNLLYSRYISIYIFFLGVECIFDSSCHQAVKWWELVCRRGAQEAGRHCYLDFGNLFFPILQLWPWNTSCKFRYNSEIELRLYIMKKSHNNGSHGQRTVWADYRFHGSDASRI